MIPAIKTITIQAQALITSICWSSYSVPTSYNVNNSLRQFVHNDAKHCLLARLNYGCYEKIIKTLTKIKVLMISQVIELI